MSILTSEALEGSPLADLHAIASEIGIDGFRRLRKADLVAAILDRQGGEAADGGKPAAEEPARPPRQRRERRQPSAAAETEAEPEVAADEEPARPPRQRRERRQPSAAAEAEAQAAAPESVEGVVEVLGNGSAFIRLSPPDASEGDVYVSAAQVRRCELVSGDRVGGPVRRPRRSERHPSLVRVETINGAGADEVAAGTPYDELPAAFPTTPVTFASKHATLLEIARIAPIGRGSRVSVTGAPGSGRTTTLRALAVELAAQEGVELRLVLAGTRPEERAEWAAAELEPVATTGLGAAPDTQSQALERVVEEARRSVARGGHVAIVVDSLDAVSAPVARRALAAARNVPDGGSLTVVAAAREPLGGETTVIALDARAGAVERRPVLDPVASFTLRLDVLVGARKATTIAKARAKAITG